MSDFSFQSVQTVVCRVLSMGIVLIKDPMLLIEKMGFVPAMVLYHISNAI